MSKVKILNLVMAGAAFGWALDYVASGALVWAAISVGLGIVNLVVGWPSEECY